MITVESLPRYPSFPDKVDRCDSDTADRCTTELVGQQNVINIYCEICVFMLFRIRLLIMVIVLILSINTIIITANIRVILVVIRITTTFMVNILFANALETGNWTNGVNNE